MAFKKKDNDASICQMIIFILILFSLLYWMNKSEKKQKELFINLTNLLIIIIITVSSHLFHMNVQQLVIQIIIIILYIAYCLFRNLKYQESHLYCNYINCIHQKYRVYWACAGDIDGLVQNRFLGFWWWLSCANRILFCVIYYAIAFLE